MICLAVLLGAMPAVSARADGGEVKAGVSAKADTTVPAAEVEKDVNVNEDKAVAGEKTKDGMTAMLSVVSTDKKVISYQASEKKKLELTVKNIGKVELVNVKIAPRVAESLKAWPFDIENKDYTVTLGKLAPGEEQKVAYEFTARETVKNQYYKLPFDFTAEPAEDASVKIEGECGIYVKTIAKVKEPEQNGTPGDANLGGTPDELPGGSDGMTGGGVSNMDVPGGGGSGSVATPRVIVTGFSTNPGEVKAGTNFKLTIHLKNTSKKTAVTNLLFDLSAPTEGDGETASPAFLPSSGSSSIYLDQIKANGTTDISIELNAKADLVQKPYSVELTMKYEDASGGQYDAASAISIPVKQDARFEFSEFQISPEVISVGEEANIMCELYNLGRVKLYNVKAKFEGNGIKTEELFLGNIESGATAGIDGMIMGEAATAGQETMKMILSYEDETGKVTTAEKEFQFEVMEPVMDMDMPADNGMVVEEKASFPIVPVIVGVLILGGVLAGVLIYQKKKKKKVEEEEEGLVDEFDRLTEDEPRES